MGGGRVAHSEHDRKRRYALAAVAQHVDIALFECQRPAQCRPPRDAPVVARCVLGPGKPGIAPCRKGCGGPELAVAVHGVGKRLAKLRVGVEVRATNRRDGERPGDLVLTGKEPYRGFAAQHPTEEVRKVPTKRVDEPQAGNGDASRACHQTPCPAVTLSTIPSRSPTVLGRGMSCGILTPSLSSNSNSSSRSMSESTLSSSSKASGVTRAGSMFSRLCRNSLRTVRLSGFMNEQCRLLVISQPGHTSAIVACLTRRPRNSRPGWACTFKNRWRWHRARSTPPRSGKSCCCAGAEAARTGCRLPYRRTCPPVYWRPCPRPRLRA